jgi:hypothetical protein
MSAARQGTMGALLVLLAATAVAQKAKKLATRLGAQATSELVSAMGVELTSELLRVIGMGELAELVGRMGSDAAAAVWRTCGASTRSLWRARFSAPRFRLFRRWATRRILRSRTLLPITVRPPRVRLPSWWCRME